MSFMAFLGLGVTGEFVAEHFHGQPYARPLRRLREYVEIIDLLLRGEPLRYEGELFRMERGFRLDFERARERVPIYLNANRERSLRQAGAIADGAIASRWPRSDFPRIRALLDEGASAAGRETRPELWMNAHAIVTSEDTAASLRDEGRLDIHRYINNQGPFVWDILGHAGYEAEVTASREAWAERRRDADGARAVISDALLEDMYLVGPPEVVRRELHERAALGADLQLLRLPGGPPAEAARALEALIAD